MKRIAAFFLAVILILVSIGALSEPAYRKYWGIQAMGFDLIRQSGTADGKILIAVIDSGIDTSHELFTGRISPLSRNFAGNPDDLSDIGGHGTTLGGIIVDSGKFGRVCQRKNRVLLKNVIGPVPSKQALAMFVGTYVGGSVNLVAMADAAKAGKNLVSAAIVADNLLMVLYFFLLSALPASGWILARYRHPIIDRRRKIESSPVEMEEVKNHHRSHKSRAAEYWKARPVSLSDLATGFAAACMIVAVSKMLAGFFDTTIAGDGFALSLLRGLLGNQYLLITTITTALATLFPQFFGSISGAQEIGTFLIHIFFAVIGAPASVELIIREAPLLLLFAAIIVLMNLVFSLVFGKAFGYSIEEITVASNANIGGPTTAAAFAIAKGWHTLIFPAILVGTLGYVIGNYYGIFLFTSLK